MKREEEHLVLETEAHAEFREKLARSFGGGDQLPATVEDYLDGCWPQPLVIHGVAGAGASAVLAKAAAAIVRTRALSDVDYCPAYRVLLERCDGAPIEPKWTGDAILIERFIGVTPRSTQVRFLLEDLCFTLDAAYNGGPFEPPAEFSELVRQFLQRLDRACRERPLIIILDALDRLSADEDALRCSWLPVALPPHVRIIASVSSEQQPCLAELRSRLLDAKILAPETASKQDVNPG